MTRRVRKTRLRIKWKALITLIVACILVVFVVTNGVRMISDAFKTDPNAFKTCGLSNTKLIDKLQDKEYEGYIEAKDYVFYGESLSFYSNEYSLGAGNAFIGKTMILKNVCNDKEITIEKIGVELDGQIHLGEIPAGLYEIYIVENLIPKRLYTSSKIIENTNFYTVTRSGSNNKVDIIADKSFLDNADTKENTDVLDRNYVFLNIEKSELPAEVYDIAINPGTLSAEHTTGKVVGDLSEIEEMYRLAEKIKTELEKSGLKVIITGESNTWTNLYGETGMLGKGYMANVKYGLNLSMANADADTSGMSVVYSAYASDAFGKEIFNTVSTGTGLKGRNREFDVLESELEGIYDVDYDIREGGGKALAAGTFTGTSSQMNAFAKNLKGMNIIFVQVFNAANASDVEAWSSDFENIATKYAEGIKNYLGIQ